MRIVFYAVFLLLFSCGFGGNKESKSSADAPEGTEAADPVTTGNITSSAWKGWHPSAELSGYTLTSFVTDPYEHAGLYSALAVYEQGATVFRVQVVDGSTDKGKSEIRDHLRIAKLNITNENPYGYEKTLVRNGVKAKEEFLKAAGEYLVTFLFKDTYGVSVKSNAGSADEVWDLIGQLKLEGLP